MKSGTERAVLMVELLSGDGPHVGVADDFLALRCSACRLGPREDAMFRSGAFLCSRCDEEPAVT